MSFRNRLLLDATCLLVEGLSELVDWGWDLQPGLEDSLLPLKTDVPEKKIMTIRRLKGQVLFH